MKTRGGGSAIENGLTSQLTKIGEAIADLQHLCLKNFQKV